MTLRLNGSTSGYVEIDAPATAGSNTLVLPTGNGTNGQYLQTNGSGSLSWATLPTAGWTRQTAVATTSGTSVTWTGIPSGVRQIVVMLEDVSTNVGNLFRVQIGDSGGIETSGYESFSTYGGGSGSGLITSGYVIYHDTAAASKTGALVLSNISGNTWIAHGVFNQYISVINYGFVCSGRKTLSDPLTQLKFDAVGGETFDLGQVNIMYS